MAITFTSEKIKFTLKQKPKVKIWIAEIIKQEKKILGELAYAFIDDQALLKINKEYLNHKTYTDIITFDYTESKKISGDIFISIDRVKDNAKKFEVDFQEELKRVIIHGVFHLCGYKDKNPADSKKMRKKEDEALQLFENS